MHLLVGHFVSIVVNKSLGLCYIASAIFVCNWAIFLIRLNYFQTNVLRPFDQKVFILQLKLNAYKLEQTQEKAAIISKII